MKCLIVIVAATVLSAEGPQSGDKTVVQPPADVDYEIEIVRPRAVDPDMERPPKLADNED